MNYPTISTKTPPSPNQADVTSSSHAQRTGGVRLPIFPGWMDSSFVPLSNTRYPPQVVQSVKEPWTARQKRITTAHAPHGRMALRPLAGSEGETRDEYGYSDEDDIDGIEEYAYEYNSGNRHYAYGDALSNGVTSPVSNTTRAITTSCAVWMICSPKVRAVPRLTR